MALPPNHPAFSHSHPPASRPAVASSSESPHGSGLQQDNNPLYGASEDSRRSTSTLHDPSEAFTPAGASEKREGDDKFSRPEDLDAQEKGEGSREKASGDVEEVVIVDWKGKDDPACPLNWSYGRRMLSTLTVAGFTLLAPLSSSMIAPAAGQVASYLNITDQVEVQMSVSIFVLAFAVGPLIFGPMSELYGRMRVLQGANLLYLVFNLVCAFAKTKGQFIAFRFISGLGGGAPLSIGAGVLSDLWRPEERGRGAALYSLMPLLGPALGPLLSGQIAYNLPVDGWRWVFYSTTIFSAFVQFIGIFLLRETYGPILLLREAHRLKRSMGLPADSDRVQTIHESKAGRKSVRQIVAHGMLRPFSLFISEQIIMLFAAYMSVIYGTIYILLTTTSSIYEGVYGQNVAIASLHYIALMLGFMAASQGGARGLDVIYRRLKAKRGGQGKPEYRLPLVFPASFILPIGLLLYGWGAQKRLHWIVPDIGLFCIGLSMILIFQASTSYMIDTFTLHAASALAATICLRSICGFAFPLFAPYMYNAIGYGWGCSILALVAAVVGGPAAPLLYIYGERIRTHSRYAHRSDAKKTDAA
ncbi:MFS general substrate transporter [Rhodotorula sp. JG-1b]|nr:MFS general substrate transporter [Rhodotorula sp. JG-1b]